jgi:NADPH-dependent 2,4-dienoyl-CoA reductase/sulfur reductase-like enzyme
MEGPVRATIADIVIIGGGQTAGRAALTLRGAGFSGRVVLISAERHLPYERPPLSKAMLLDDVAVSLQVLTPELIAELKINVELGVEATSLDHRARTVTLEDGREFGYAKLLLATGCRVRRLSLPGLAEGDVTYLRTLGDARVLKSRMEPGSKIVIIGGGFIGLEVAAAARARGCEATVLEMADRIMPRLGCREASEAAREQHERAGIRIVCGVGVVGAEGRDLVTTSGDRISSDVIVAGIGVHPNIELAQAAGLAVGDGILTDQYGQTSEPLIFAAGDVTCQFHPRAGRHLRLESWQNANHQGESAARGMLGNLTTVSEVPWVWSDQGDVCLQIAGTPSHVDEVVVRKDPESPTALSFFQLFQGRLVGGVTLNRAKDMPLIRRWLSEQKTPTDKRQLADGSQSLRKVLTDGVAAA